jgi:hypothetical protein
MSGLSIPQPGVEVEQDFVAETASPATPAQQEVIVGPCFQVVSALDDNGLPLPEALAGAYRDGFGVIAYPLPGLSPGALVTGFLEDIRVFLSLGSMRRELHSVYDEVSIFSGSDSKIAGTPWSACVLTDPGVNFVTEGVAEGDVVRVTYQGEVRDVLVSSVAATQLGLDEDSLTRAFGTPTSGSVDIDFATYSVIRNPAEFAYVEAASVARYTLGSDSDYVVFRVKTTAPTAYLGDGGDGLQIAMAAQPYTLRDSSCFVGANIFWDTSAGQNFVATVGAIGAVTSRYLLIGAVGASAALLDVLRVVSNQILVIENGATANQTAQNYVVAISVDSGVNGATGGGDETAFTSAGQNFNTSIPNTAGTPDTATLLEISGVGVFTVVAVVSDTALTISAGAGAGLAAQTYTVVQQLDTGTGTGQTGKDNTGGQTTVCFAGGGLTTDILTGRAIITLTDGDTWEGGAYAAQPAGAHLAGYLANVTADLIASGTAVEAEVVDRNTDLSFVFDPTDRILTVLAGRGTDGLSTGGVQDPGSSGGVYIHEALTDPLDSAYDADISAIFESVVNGDMSPFTFTEAFVRSGVFAITFDGGAGAGDLLVDADLLGSTTPTALVYVSYKALRLDVTAAADVPLFYEIGNATQAVALLGPAPGNPLCIAALKAIAASPDAPIRVLGVSAVSGAKPFGTETAYQEALAFLEAKKVYVVVVLTQDPVVGQYLQAHVDAMSEPDQKAERLGILNSQLPTHAQATVVASGTAGNTGTVAGDSTADFAGDADFSLAQAEAGDILVVTAKAGAQSYLDSVDGTVGPLYGAPILGIKAGDNFIIQFDGTDIPSSWNGMVDVSWTLYRPGPAISVAADQAEAVAKIAEGYADRRIIHVWPDSLTGPVDGVDSVLEGFYGGAVVGALIGAKGPADPLTNTNVPGFTGVKHSSGYFTRRQLNRIAGGGNLILAQDASGAPIYIRHQLTTDTSTIEKREISVTTALDYVAEVYRTTLGPQIGRVNITDNLLTDLAGKAESINAAMKDQRILRRASLLAISEDPESTDRLIFDVGVVSLVPNNYNRVRILVGGA